MLLRMTSLFRILILVKYKKFKRMETENKNMFLISYFRCSILYSNIHFSHLNMTLFNNKYNIYVSNSVSIT